MDAFKVVWFCLELGGDLSAFRHVVLKQIRLWAKETELFFGIDHSRLFVALQHKLLSVLKAILLEAKILVISESPEQCSRAVLGLLSLLPGGLWLGFNSDGFGNRHFQYQKHGFPLQCFGPRCCVYPYMGLHMLDSLIQMRGFLIGTTNRIFLDRTSPHLVLEVPGQGNSFSLENRMQYDGQWFRDRRHGNGTLTIEAAGKAMGLKRSKQNKDTYNTCPWIDVLES
eukprot:Skav205610  [mRNA]  locus=scaffold460:215426:221809:+ [translate_table: standard]